MISEVRLEEALPGQLQATRAAVEQAELSVERPAPMGWGVPDFAPGWGFRRQADEVSISVAGRNLQIRDVEEEDREKPPKGHGVEGPGLTDPAVYSGAVGGVLDDGPEDPPDDDREKPPKRRGGVDEPGVDPAVSDASVGSVLDEEDREKPPKGHGVGGGDNADPPALLQRAAELYRYFG